MELVRAASLTGYFAVAEDLRLEVVPLLRRAGITRRCSTNPEQVIPARSVVRLLEDSAEASGCITFGLRMAEHRQISDLGMVSLLHRPPADAGRGVRGARRIPDTASIRT